MWSPSVVGYTFYQLLSVRILYGYRTFSRGQNTNIEAETREGRRQAEQHGLRESFRYMYRHVGHGDGVLGHRVRIQRTQGPPGAVCPACIESHAARERHSPLEDCSRREKSSDSRALGEVESEACGSRSRSRRRSTPVNLSRVGCRTREPK